MASFWDTLPKPFFALAPMADVTDPAYRRLIAETAPPSVMWTEFVSADGLYHTREKKGMKDEENPLMRDLLFSPNERPIVAQFFTSNPEMMEYAGRLAQELGFDGVDINMGCPDKSIEKQGAGAALIKTPELAQELIRSANKGTGGLPVSVKTRLGFNQMEYQSWLPALLSEDIKVLTIHMRTRKEMSKVPAHYELAEEVVGLCKSIRSDVLVALNGDVESLKDGQTKAEQYGADGIMLGRAIFGNPWLFAGKEPRELSPEERIESLHTLARYFSEMTPPKHYAILKKHFKAFVNGFDGASELREKLMQTTSYAELDTVLSEVSF